MSSYPREDDDFDPDAYDTDYHLEIFAVTGPASTHVATIVLEDIDKREAEEIIAAFAKNDGTAMITNRNGSFAIRAAHVVGMYLVSVKIKDADSDADDDDSGMRPFKPRDSDN